MPHPLDEYPIHQAPVSMAYPATTDKDFYDRNIFQVIPHGNHDVQMICGFGVYPNLGVQDAFACIRVGTKQYSTRASDAFDDDRMKMHVGPIRIEIIEPLNKVRVICERQAGDPANGDDTVAFDLTWTAAVPMHDEEFHQMRTGNRMLIQAQRFVGIGYWEGEMSVAGQSWTVDHNDWTGTRDRSWGIRPSGEAVPPGRWAAEIPPKLYHFWIPMRFADFSTFLIVQEDPNGFRTLNEAVRLWGEASEQGTEQLGWPRFKVDYISGTRLPHGCAIDFQLRNGDPLRMDIEVLGSMALHLGCGYGADVDWSHGQWKGRDWVDSVMYDLEDPAIKPRIPFGVIDHIAKATIGDQVGYGIFEHGSVGRHDPSGFADLMSVAP